MSDRDKRLISQQAVLDAIHAVPRKNYHQDRYFDEIYKAIDALEPASPEPKPRVGQEEPDYKAMYFEGDATIKKVYVTIKEHIERRFVKIEARKSRTDVREKPEVKDGKQDELRSQRKPPTDCPPEKEKR